MFLRRRPIWATYHITINRFLRYANDIGDLPLRETFPRAAQAMAQMHIRLLSR